mmetsp:Transcript_17731/g.38306  ORF Transcript_17731/g.38306 Transcript_17731/m.38306 type:complete len:135 (+) Transcript_17731:551-955(+)
MERNHYGDDKGITWESDTINLSAQSATTRPNKGQDTIIWKCMTCSFGLGSIPLAVVRFLYPSYHNLKFQVPDPPLLSSFQCSTGIKNFPHNFIFDTLCKYYCPSFIYLPIFQRQNVKRSFFVTFSRNTFCYTVH